MGDAIDFPKNHDIYLIKAAHYFELGDFKKAEEYIEKAYRLKKTNTSNVLYATILFEREKFEEAKDIADEFFHIYERKEETKLFYMSLLVKLRQFIQAETLTNKWKIKTNELYSEQWEDMMEEIEIEKNIMYQEEKAKQQRIIEEFKKMSAYPLEHQFGILQEINNIPRPIFQQYSRAHLVHPDTSNEMKTILLQYLIDQGSTDQYHIEWFGQIREVVPNDVVSFEQNPIFVKIQSYLEDELSNSPTSLNMIEQEVNRHLIKLFPFIDEVVSDAKMWVDLYLEKYQPFLDPSYDPEQYKINREIEGNESIEEMERWFNRLNQADLGYFDE